MSVTRYAIIVTLPDTEDVIVLAHHESEEDCKWSESIRDSYLTVLESVRKEAKEEANLASTKVLPYYAELTHPTGRLKGHFSPNEEGMSMKIKRPAGVEKEPGGLRLVLIHKSSGAPYWRDSFKTACSNLKIKDWNSLETRSNRKLIEIAAKRETPASKALKLVAIPADVEVRIQRNRQSEFVTEVPRRWS